MSKKQVVWIDSERCTGCGACVDACPVGAIALVGGKAQVDDERCTGCHACLEVCPQHAIQPIVEGELVSAEEATARSRSPVRSVSQPPAVQRARPLVETAAPVIAGAGAGQLAKATRALARAVGGWLTQPSGKTGPSRTPEVTEPTARPRIGPANGRGRRMRRRRRGR